MKRREFIKGIPLVAAPFLLQGIPINLIGQNSMLSQLAAGSNSERVLILIQLHGGNDGLNTLIPIQQYNQYFDLRSNIAIADKGNRRYIPLDNTLPDPQKIGLHPDMSAMKALYDQGKVSIVQNVAYSNLNMSHFRSRDIWLMGGDADDYMGSGWMGRFLQTRYQGYPEGYPSSEMPDPPAIEIGTGVSLAFHGDGDHSVPLSLSIDNPDQFYDLIQKVKNTVPPETLLGTPYKNELDYIVGMEQKSNQYADRLKQVFDKGMNTPSVTYPTRYALNAPKAYLNNILAPQLKLIARLLSGGCKTRVFLTRITNFDTHARQVEDFDPSIGGHAALLYHISTAMKAFQDDLSGLGLDKRVMSVTFSEFGRRAVSNYSYGTDHGFAAPMFVFGSCVKPGVTGKPDLDNLSSGNLQMQYDYRQVFTNLLQDWMGATDQDLQNCKFEEYKATKLDLVQACDATGTTDGFFNDRFYLGNCVPNPARNTTTLQYRINTGCLVVIKIYSETGKLIKEVMNEYKEAGSFEVAFDLRGMLPGIYVYKIEAGQFVASKKLVVMQ